MSLQSHLVGVTANTLYFHNLSHGSAHAGEVSFVRRTTLCFVNISVPPILLAECQHFVSANFSRLWKELTNNMGFRNIFCCSLLLDGIWYNTSSRPISIVGYVVTMQSNVWSYCCCHFFKKNAPYYLHNHKGNMFMNCIKLNMNLWIILDFEDLLTQNTSDPVKGLTISTDESTKVIKVLSVNGARQTSLLTTLNAKQQVGLICYNLL